MFIRTSQNVNWCWQHFLLCIFGANYYTFVHLWRVWVCGYSPRWCGSHPTVSKMT